MNAQLDLLVRSFAATLASGKWNVGQTYALCATTRDTQEVAEALYAADGFDENSFAVSVTEPVRGTMAVSVTRVAAK